MLGSIELPEGALGAAPKPKLLTARHQPVNNFKPNIAHTFVSDLAALLLLLMHLGCCTYFTCCLLLVVGQRQMPTQNQAQPASFACPGSLLVKVLLHRTQRTGGDVSSDHTLPCQRLHPLTSEGNLYHPLCVCSAPQPSVALLLCLWHSLVWRWPPWACWSSTSDCWASTSRYTQQGAARMAVIQ